MSAVVWKKLGDVCEVHTGEQLNRNDMVDDGQFPVINGGKEPSGYTNSFNEQANSITISQGGESAGYVNWIDKDFWAGAHCYVVENKENTVKKFLYYSLKNIEIILQSTKQGAGIPGLNRKKLYEQIIPIPSLAKQQEIVSHLDTFTTLISNLESELDMRRKQYEHYRNQLLDISGKDSKYIVPFGDICKIIRGNGVQKADFVEEGFGCIHYGQIYTHYGSYSYTTNRFVSQDVFNKAVKASKGDIIMTDTSENVEDICKSVAYLGDEDIAVSNHSFIIKHNQNPKYLSFCTLTYSFGLQKKKVVFGAKVSSIKQDNLAKINIYLPPIEEQNQIVSKLDAFENLIQSFEQEIKLRKQQYEYYREKLLTFEKE